MCWIMPPSIKTTHSCQKMLNSILVMTLDCILTDSYEFICIKYYVLLRSQKKGRCTALHFKPNDLLKQLFSSDVTPPGICVTCLNQAFSCVSMCSHSELNNGLINSFPFLYILIQGCAFNHRRTLKL